ncbi:transketolase-like TK C-terminal-containing protein [Sediminivirga luteola]|uniref:Pyruvate dehydrogenase E1 component n=1 Tax=Sediminivirga luteola TaxID=1774748 RepID=A0A8J2XIM3_9MICO|nr:pyruvate dehydrogenase [Sediminivirga luteola]GGA17146.1 pyruvate dehydrogenase E1 component [Sediminivirga luteola]
MSDDGRQFETSTQQTPAPTVNERPLTAASSLRGSTLDAIAQRVLWLSTAIIDAANRGRANPDGVKVGGHQSSSASMVGIMTALWFAELGPHDRVSVKPHASPVLHAIAYLLGELEEGQLGTLRARGGLQAYPSRSKDPHTVDFSTGSVGIGATAPLWAALSRRYLRDHFGLPPGGRFISLLGDAEMDEGAVWEAIIDPEVRQLGEAVWIVDLNRQSLDRVIPDVQIARLQGMFAAADWQVLTCKWGRRLQALFARPGGDALRRRLEEMPNEEYQRLLRSHPRDVPARLLGDSPGPALAELVAGLGDVEVAEAVRDLGGHDIQELLATYAQIDDSRPTVIFAYTIKGRGLATEGHPSNHAAQLTEEQMHELASLSGTDLEDPWQRFPAGSEEAELCARTAERLRRPPLPSATPPAVPVELKWPHKQVTSTQATLGRLLSDLKRAEPEVARRVVTVSPDVASSTNLGGWINKTGIWSASDRRDWFADDADRVLRWQEDPGGQHMQLGIAEVNLVGLIGELGATWSRWGEPLIPIGTIYDPFVGRALEPWMFGIYAGGQSILVGTPSGVTLAPEGGAHQSVNTPSIGVSTPGIDSWEPAFAQDLEWTLLHAMSQLGRPGGTSAYFRLSTRPVEQSLANLPGDPAVRERRRRQVIAGGYRLSSHRAAEDEVLLVGTGAVMPNVCAAARTLAEQGVRAGIVCVTSASKLFAALMARDDPGAQGSPAILEQLFPAAHPVPLVTVLDGHPHALSFLSGVRGDRMRMLGVREFGQSASLSEAYALHNLDAGSIAAAALDQLGR